MTNLSATVADASALPDAPPRVRGYWGTVGFRLRDDWVTLFFLAVTVLVVAAAILAPLLAPFDPTKTSMLYRMKPIGFRNFALGTDELGRDMLSRRLWGGRVSLTMGLGPVACATVVGGLLGVVANDVHRRGSAMLALQATQPTR